jgi:beta-lactam-binding protein with PASTA domain
MRLRPPTSVQLKKGPPRALRFARPTPLTVVTVVLGLLTILAVQFVGGTPRRHMPSVVGKTKLVALKRMANHDLIANVVVDRAASRRLGPRNAGKVVNQTWDRGIALPEGATVTLTLSPRRGQGRD